MNEEIKKEVENENGQLDDGSVNIYDDNAYMFGDEPSGNNSEEHNELKDINQNNYINTTEEDNEGINNSENKESCKKYIEKELQNNNSKNNDQEISKDLIQNEKMNVNINNLPKEENKIQQKITIEQNNTDENEIKESEINKMENMNQNYEYEENEVGEEEENMENGEMEEEIEGEGEGEVEGEEENIPLVTLKFISICQYCKNSFKSTIHIPYLLKCGHFFCEKCIKEHFTDEEGIKCPNDGLVALSIKELKILNNLITDRNIPTQRDQKENDIEENENINGINNNLKLNENNYCKIHKGQKLTHIITENKQLICIYCAFDLVRKNPNCEIKEIKEKFDELENEAEKLINLNQNNIKIIQDSLNDIKKNKEIEEKNINIYFENISKYLNNKKNEYLSQIDSIFTDNAKKLSQKLEIFSEQIEQGELLKVLINNYEQTNNFDEILETYFKLKTYKTNEQENHINLQEYKFSHDDETKIMKYINNFGDIKTVNKCVLFQNWKKDLFNLKNSRNQTSTNIEPKKNYFNFNSSPAITNLTNNNKNSFRLSNNLMDNQELQSEIKFNNINNASENRKISNSNYNFNFNKINPMSNNNNNNKKNTPSKPILSDNIFRMGSNTEINNGNMNYTNFDMDNKNKNYSFNNLINNNNLRGNIINNGDYRINNNYNLNYSKRIMNKDNSLQNSKNQKKNINIKNNFENPSQNSLGYEYKGFKTFHFNK